MCPKAHLLRHLMLLDRLKWKWTGSVCVCMHRRDKETWQTKARLHTCRASWHACRHTHSEEKKRSTFEKLRHDSTLRKQLPVKTSVHELQAAPGGDIAYVFSAGSRIKGAVGFVPCCHYAAASNAPLGFLFERSTDKKYMVRFTVAALTPPHPVLQQKKLTPLFCSLQRHLLGYMGWDEMHSMFFFFQCELVRKQW